eukprot:30497-Pelagococcus_subviridis.AAC.28
MKRPHPIPVAISANNMPKCGFFANKKQYSDSAVNTNSGNTPESPPRMKKLCESPSGSSKYHGVSSSSPPPPPPNRPPPLPTKLPPP